MARRPLGDRLLLVAFFLSGGAALGYELLWTRLLALALGSEILGVFGVQAGFFGGLALGALLFHRRARQARRPARLYALLELVAAVYALASPHLLHWLSRTLPAALAGVAGDNRSATALLVTLVVSALVLLPGTVCLGATLPTLVEARARARTGALEGRRGLGRLYAANTLGATGGVLAAVYLVLPAVGLARGALALALAGVLSAALAWIWDRGAGETPAADGSEEPPQTGESELPRWLLLLVVGCTGLAGIGVEVVGVRVLGQVFENTVYTFANVLAVFLLGTGAGAAVYARLAPRLPADGRTTAVLLLGLALSVFWAGAAARMAPTIQDAVAPAGAAVHAHLLGEALAAGGVFLLPTLLMGATYSHVVGLLAPGGVGRPAALNTLFAALAPFLFGLLAIPALQYADALYLAALIYLVLFGLVAWRGGRSRLLLAVGVLAVALAYLAAPASLGLVEPDEGWRVVHRTQGVFGTVQVVERRADAKGDPGAAAGRVRRLYLNRRFRMGGRHSFAERRMGHMPLLLAPPRARAALFLGVATGATAGAACSHPLERIDAVEIVPEILDAVRFFDDVNNGLRVDPHVTLHGADARRFVSATGLTYDVIVADLFHPGREGAGSLYTVEHFEAVRDRLTQRGLFGQWLPLYQLEPADLKTILRTFLAVFPEAHAFLGLHNAQMPILLLVGAVRPLRLDPHRLMQRLRQRPPSGRDLPGLFVQDVRDLLGSYLLDRRGLARFAGEGPLNTDLVPRVLFDAPTSAYEDAAELGYRSLERLLPHRIRYPEEIVELADARDRAGLRLAVSSYARAAALYLKGDLVRAEQGRFDPPETIELLLQAYQADPGFSPARGLLYLIAARRPDAGAIYERMLARTPGEARLYRAYLAHLRRRGPGARIPRLLEQARAHGVSLDPGGGRR
jgi:spermidine synthase